MKGFLGWPQQHRSWNARLPTPLILNKPLLNLDANTKPRHLPPGPCPISPLPQDMVRRGCERNVITYSSLISACEKAGRWELALELFQEMHTEGCRPNVVTYNSLIAACAQGKVFFVGGRLGMTWELCAQ